MDDTLDENENSSFSELLKKASKFTKVPVKSLLLVRTKNSKVLLKAVNMLDIMMMRKNTYLI